jgi:hypothetical protein
MLQSGSKLPSVGERRKKGKKATKYSVVLYIYSQNYWVFWTFSIVWYSREHDVSETGSFSVIR